MNKSIDAFGLAALGFVIVIGVLCVLGLILIRPLFRLVGQQLSRGTEAADRYRDWAERMGNEERETAKLQRETATVMAAVVGSLQTLSGQTEVTLRMQKELMQLNERVVARLERVASRLEGGQLKGAES